MYIRVSTDEQQLGPAAQLRAVQAWAKREGVRIVATFQESVSGAAPLERRPQLEAAIGALDDNAAGLFLVHRRDRLARDVVAAAMVERLVERAGARVVSADGVSNGDGAEAQLQRGLMDLFGQYERALIRNRTRAAMAVKKSRGELTGAAPFGQRVAEDGVRLELHQGEAATVARVRQLRAAGLSLRDVAARLEAEGHRSRKGTPLGLTQVARIDRRPA